MDKNQELILIELGFNKPTDYELYNYTDYFQFEPEYYKHSYFGVRGDHAHDVVDICYVEKDEIKGFYYSSSLVDQLAMWGYEKEILEIFERIKEIAQEDNVPITYIKRNNTYLFISECALSKDWEAKSCIGILEKAAVIFDLLLRKIEDDHYERERLRFEAEENS